MRPLKPRHRVLDERGAKHGVVAEPIGVRFWADPTFDAPLPLRQVESRRAFRGSRQAIAFAPWLLRFHVTLAIPATWKEVKWQARFAQDQRYLNLDNTACVETAVLTITVEIWIARLVCEDACSSNLIIM